MTWALEVMNTRYLWNFLCNQRSTIKPIGSVQRRAPHTMLKVVLFKSMHVVHLFVLSKTGLEHETVLPPSKKKATVITIDKEKIIAAKRSR